MKDVLVLGIGNRLMLDDGIGVYVVEELDKRNTNPDIRYVIGETDTYFCLNQIRNASYTIIVDAACLSKEPGTISIFQLSQVVENPVQPISIHDSHLLCEIKITGKSIEGLFIVIEPYEINYYFGLSVILQDLYFKILEEIENIINSHIL
jgi:hydrogenase maturation protease